MKAWVVDFLSNVKSDIKRAHTSLTIWFGVLCEFLIEYLPQITQAITDMEPYVFPETYKRVMQVIMLITIALRFRTTKALRNK